MCNNFANRQWWRRLRRWSRKSSRANRILIIPLLLLHQICSHALSEKANENNFGHLDFNSNIYNNSTIHGSSRAAVEGNSVGHSIRFRDFEPRKLSAFRSPAAESKANIMISEENTRSSKVRKSVLEKRRARGIHFEADGNDLSINLEFIIPFFRVPMARSTQITQSVFRKLADLNSGTLLIGGAFAVVSALIVAAVKAVVTSTFYGYGYKKDSRAADYMDGFTFASYAPQTGESVTMTKSVNKVEDVFNGLERNLHAHNINVSACAQRAICSYVQRASADVQAGRGSPTERIIDGIVNLDLLKGYLNGTALQNAVDLGRKRDATTCELIYRNCKWSKMQTTAWKVALDFLGSYFEKFG